ncbi:MAG: hypothetical protein ABI846_05840 [Rudaea sp.]
MNFSWRQPTSDEFVNYQTFLQMPFPDNALQAGNGHRPVFPNLVIIAELAWMHGDHWLQFAVGLIAACATSALIALAAWRDRQSPLIVRAACTMLAVLGVFWLANGRMLFHSYESVHVYLLTLAVVVAGFCVHEASRRQRVRWMVGACAAAAFAMFCFGSGVAVFPAIIILGFALRLPARWYGIPAATLAFCLYLYLFALPGDQGVRGLISMHPIDSATIAIDWLSSPWVRGWLGHAEPTLDPIATTGIAYSRMGPQLIATANAATALTHLSWSLLARIISVTGIAAFLYRFIRMTFDRTRRPSRLEVIASMLCLFALATACVIGLGRLGYFEAHPEQVYADRYLVWPSLFWTGLALLFVCRLRSDGRGEMSVALTAAVAVLPLALLPTHDASAIWGSVVYRRGEQSAAVARSGIFDPGLFPDGADASREDVLKTLALMRKQRVAMFADGTFATLGELAHGSLAPANHVTASARISGIFDDPENQLHAAHFEGMIDEGLRRFRQGAKLGAVDKNGRIVGLAEFSYIRSDHALMFTMPAKRGFDGYIRDYRKDETYRLILLPKDGGDASVICGIAANPASP